MQEHSLKFCLPTIMYRAALFLQYFIQTDQTLVRHTSHRLTDQPGHTHVDWLVHQSSVICRLPQNSKYYPQGYN